MDNNELNLPPARPQDFADGGDYFEFLLDQRDDQDDDFDTDAALAEHQDYLDWLAGFDIDAAEADLQQWLAHRHGEA